MSFCVDTVMSILYDVRSSVALSFDAYKGLKGLDLV